MRRDYLIKILFSVAALSTGLTASLLSNNLLYSVGGIAASFGLFKSAKRTSNIQGKTDRIKLLNSLVSNLIEFSVLAFTAYFVSEPIVSTVLVALTGFSMCFKLSLENSSKNNIYSIFSRTERIGFLLVSMAAGFFNAYLLLYGLIGLSGLIVADLLYTVYRFLS